MSRKEIQLWVDSSFAQKLRTIKAKKEMMLNRRISDGAITREIAQTDIFNRIEEELNNNHNYMIRLDKRKL